LAANSIGLRFSTRVL